MRNFEENLRRLDEIIEHIDEGASLTASLELYKAGLELVTNSAEELSAFEAEIKLLRVENGELKIEKFGSELSE